jgi:hypothetical protein
VAEDRWAQCIEWARYARANPAFELEQRVYRMGIAAAIRELFDAAREGRPLGDRLRATGKQVLNTRVPVVAAGQLQRLVDWSESDEQDLTRALRNFIAEDEPFARVDRFVEAIERGPGAERFVGGGLVVASLLSFAASPERFPIVHPGRFGRLQQLVGEDRAQLGSPVEEYRRWVAFADRVGTALRNAGVPVRDMLDAESLITICAREQGLWAQDEGALDPPRVPGQTLSVISVLIPTMPSREWHLRRCVDALNRTTPTLDLVVELDEGTSNWGTKIARAAERAKGDYLFLAADDIQVLPGWWQAASAVCDQGKLPAPRVLLPDGRVQSFGNLNVDAEDGAPTAFSRFPFLSREQWDVFGPTLPIHHSDRILGFRARRAGVETVVCRDYSLIHHWAMPGRMPKAVAYREMREAELAEGFDEPWPC